MVANFNQGVYIYKGNMNSRKFNNTKIKKFHVVIATIAFTIFATYGTNQLLSTSKSGTSSSLMGESKKCITSLTLGRLGNKMGIHAAALGLAQMNGYQALLEPSMASEMGEYFDLSTPVIHGSKPWIDKVVTHYMQEEYLHFNDGYIRLVEYVNSWTFYHHMRPTILQEFTFKKELLDKAQMVLQSISSFIKRNATFVGVHVRRGDYVTVMAETYNGVIADENYINDAIGIFRTKYSDSVFVVVSDDREWCRNNIDNSKGDMFVVGSEGSSPGQDMATLVACNHTIMTVGTFGFWASYLCGGDVIYLANYTLPGAKRLNIQRYNSSFLPEWRGIAADVSPLFKPN